jgi:hypothetical protein
MLLLKQSFCLKNGTESLFKTAYNWTTGLVQQQCFH